MLFHATPCWEFFLGPLEDLMIQILCVASVVTIGIGLWQEKGHAEGALEGIAILIAISLVVSVSA